MCALAIYLMVVLSSPYVIIMYCSIKASGHGNNVVGKINAAEKRYIQGK